MDFKAFFMKRCTGRASRREYWLYQLNWWISALAIGSLIYWVGLNSTVEYLHSFIFDFVFAVVLLAVLSAWSWIAVTVRRLHDVGKSGKNTFWILIPVIGLILVALIAVRPSDAGENCYGTVGGFSWKKSYQPWILGVSLLVLVMQPGSWFIAQQIGASCGLVTSVKIPWGIKHIPAMAFGECSSLEKVVVPEGVISIYGLAFEKCTSLREVTLPASLEKSDFESCSSLEKIVIPSKVKIIDYHTFDGCTALKEVVLSEGLTVIGMEAFAGCSSLKEITIPKSVKNIKSDAFARCSALQTVTVNSESLQLESGTFKGCSELKDVYIYGLVTVNGYDIFSHCPKLEKVWTPFYSPSLEREIPYGVSRTL